MAQQCVTFILLFTVDSVMVAMERLVFKVAHPIQEFILRRLLGELQEVNNKPSTSPSLQLTNMPPSGSANVYVFFSFTAV